MRLQADAVAKGSSRLIAADQFRKANDCYVPKQSLQVNCLIGPLYTSKLPLESDDHPVTALPCADLELSTHSSLQFSIKNYAPICNDAHLATSAIQASLIELSAVLSAK